MGLGDLNMCVSSVSVAGFGAGGRLKAGPVPRPGVRGHPLPSALQLVLVVGDHPGRRLLPDLLCKSTLFTKAVPDWGWHQFSEQSFGTPPFLIWPRKGPSYNC